MSNKTHRNLFSKYVAVVFKLSEDILDKMYNIKKWKVQLRADGSVVIRVVVYYVRRWM